MVTQLLPGTVLEPGPTAPETEQSWLRG